MRRPHTPTARPLTGAPSATGAPAPNPVRLRAERPEPRALTPSEFAAFCALFYERTGIRFGDGKRYFVEKRVAQRMDATGARSPGAYLERVRDPRGEEFQRLVNALTINETYFFREDFQFRAMVDELLPRVVARRPRGARVRIWSIPCSTGEEPYSLAIWLLENWRDVDRYTVEIVASDIDTDAIAAAKAGRYASRAVHKLGDRLLAKYFDRVSAGEWQLVEPLRRSVDFAPHPLVPAAPKDYYRNFDIVFCRNLLIYFDQKSRQAAIDALFESLAPGGYCLLGHSDSIGGASLAFSTVQLEGTVAYERPK